MQELQATAVTPSSFSKQAYCISVAGVSFLCGNRMEALVFPSSSATPPHVYLLKYTLYFFLNGLWNSVSATLPTGQLSNVPWRRSGVRYTNNEAYFDVTEEVDAIIDKSGATVAAEIQGYVSWTVCQSFYISEYQSNY